MPNKYSHGAVLAQYSSRGWINLANNDYVGYNADSSRQQINTRASAGRKELVRAHSGGKQFSDGSYIRPKGKDNDKKGEQPARHLIIDGDPTWEANQTQKNVEPRASSPQRSLTAESNEIAKRSQATCHREEASDQRPKPSREQISTCRDEAVPKLQGSDRPRLMFRSITVASEKWENLVDHHAGRYMDLQPTTKSIETLDSIIPLTSARTKLAKVGDYWTTATYEERGSKTEGPQRPVPLRLKSATDQRFRIFEDLERAEQMQSKTRGKEEPPPKTMQALPQIKPPRTEYQRPVSNEDQRPKSQGRERPQAGHFETSNAQPSDAIPSRLEPNPEVTQLRREAPQRRSAYDGEKPSQPQPIKSTMAGLPTPPASDRAPSAPPEMSDHRALTGPADQEIESRTRQRQNPRARLRQEESRTSIMTQIFDPIPSKSSTSQDSQQTHRSSWVPKPVPPPTDLPDSIQDFSDSDGEPAERDHSSTETKSQPNPVSIEKTSEHYQAALMAKKSVKCPSFVMEPTVKAEPRVHHQSHVRSHSTNHPLASFTSAASNNDRAVHQSSQTSSAAPTSTISTHTRNTPLSPKSPSLFSQDLEPFSDFSDVDSLDGIHEHGDTFSNFSNDTDVSTFQYGPFTGPSTLPQADFGIYGAISTSRGEQHATSKRSSRHQQGKQNLFSRALPLRRQHDQKSSINDAATTSTTPSHVTTSSSNHSLSAHDPSTSDSDSDVYSAAPSPRIPRVARHQQQQPQQQPPPPSQQQQQQQHYPLKPPPHQSSSSSSSRPRPQPSTKSSSSLSSLGEKLHILNRTKSQPAQRSLRRSSQQQEPPPPPPSIPPLPTVAPLLSIISSASSPHSDNGLHLDPHFLTAAAAATDDAHHQRRRPSKTPSYTKNIESVLGNTLGGGLSSPPPFPNTATTTPLLLPPTSSSSSSSPSSTTSDALHRPSRDSLATTSSTTTTTTEIRSPNDETNTRRTRTGVGFPVLKML